jgi:Lon protease-like protein
MPRCASTSRPPAVLRVFPLTGCILLPGNWLPLHIFEPRYRALVTDAIASDQFIGMVQPVIPAADNAGPVEEVDHPPQLHGVGGAGRIEHYLPEPDGRFHILVKGVTRFRLLREAPQERGYRRFEVSYEGYDADAQEPGRALDASEILDALQVLRASHSLSIDPDDFKSLSGIAVLNGLAAALPFSPAEKQALLEALAPCDRQKILLALMTMGFRQGTGTRTPPPGTVH